MENKNAKIEEIGKRKLPGRQGLSIRVSHCLGCAELKSEQKAKSCETASCVPFLLLFFASRECFSLGDFSRFSLNLASFSQEIASSWQQQPQQSASIPEVVQENS